MSPELLDYLRHIRSHQAPTTYDRKRYQLQVFLQWLEERTTNWQEVNRADVELFLLARHCSSQYRRACCGVIREFYEFVRLRYPLLCPLQNPAAGIQFLPQHTRRLPEVPSEAAVDAIFDRLSEQDGELCTRDRLAAELAYGSGLRRCELRRLNIEDIDLDQGTAAILGKGDKTRLVPLTATAILALRHHLAHRHASRGPLLLSRFGKRLAPNSLYYVLADRVGMRPHLLRHACATHLLANGCGVRLIQELLGHNRLTTTTVYTHITRKELAQVIARAHPRTTHAVADPQRHASATTDHQAFARLGDPDPAAAVLAEPARRDHRHSISSGASRR